MVGRVQGASTKRIACRRLRLLTQSHSPRPKARDARAGIPPDAVAELQRHGHKIEQRGVQWYGTNRYASSCNDASGSIHERLSWGGRGADADGCLQASAANMLLSNVVTIGARRSGFSPFFGNAPSIRSVARPCTANHAVSTSGCQCLLRLERPKSEALRSVRPMRAAHFVPTA